MLMSQAAPEANLPKKWISLRADVVSNNVPLFSILDIDNFSFS